VSELEEKLNSILGDPQTMSQIMSLAQSLSGGASNSAPQPEEPKEPPPAESGGTTAVSTPDLSALLGSLMGGASGSVSSSSSVPTPGSGGLDPRMLTMASKVLSEYQSGDDSRTALLQALRPFVKEKRYAKLDKAIQIAKLSRMIRVALDAFKGGGDDHV
jgi:hypothetical protein